MGLPEGSRPLRELPAGRTVFIDANVFIYHFTGLSEECSHFLERCERGELAGITGVHIVLEVLHRLMMIEAVARGMVSPSNVARKLREKPEVVRELSDYRRQAETIEEMGVTVRDLSMETVKRSHSYRQRDGLLVNDSLTIALMASEGVALLATADPDFARVQGLKIFSPSDLPAGKAEGHPG